MDIKEYCDNNKDYSQLLNMFTDVYMGALNKRTAAQRADVKKYIHRNLGYWFYSNHDPLSSASPANFINSDLACTFEQKAVAYPKCKPVYKRNKLAEIKYEFNVYTLESHPFIKDMATAIQIFQAYNFPGEGFQSLSGEDIDAILNDPSSGFAIYEQTYLATLFDVCLDLKLTAWEDPKHPHKIIVNEAAYQAFFSLTVKRQLLQIVSVILKEYIQAINARQIFTKPPTERQLFAMLKKSMDADEFLKSVFGDLMNEINIWDFLDDFEDDGDDEDDSDDYDDDVDYDDDDDYDDDVDYDDDDDYDDDGDEDDDEEEDDEDTDEDRLTRYKGYFKILLAGAVTHRYFFIPLSQYLQLVEQYNTVVFKNQLDAQYMGLQNVEDSSMKGSAIFMNYMSPPDYYRLTSLGIEVLRDGKPESKQKLNDIPHGQYKQVLDGMLAMDLETNAMQEVFGGMLSDLQNVSIKPKNAKKTMNAIGDGGNPKDKRAVFVFEVKKWRSKGKAKTITLKGADTLANLALTIVAEFNLESFHMYSFYFGDKFYDNDTEIGMSESDNGERGSAEYRLYELGLKDNQNFLFLYDFGTEHRFQIKFTGMQ